ncbi:F-type H+-transporting ATPase subunit delta [Ereboglobus sp. PH5-5]|uniref:F0F1 ATP synthase subunit delta n=1 Tax=unclassified Ereboglobus TaxID=2626932 RepID=UPI002406686A|nr:MULTISPECIES: F0F1 ATP synthase subunit delta [unclassified Ereboglobus]MDF9826207.1 F-type H+-transporting ATPase subunit delta [Ereboglobus sp. PH5-10]MDF9832225.1 F-type H+-transporting ATPase subunit delta [Ereboglobus sp. PH5-5]
MKPGKKTTQFARQLVKLSLGADGRPSSERVAAVLVCVEKMKPSGAIALLKAYRHFLAIEVARTQALIEHAGPVSDAIIAQIAAAMTKHYARPVAPAPKPAPELLAGLRVRVGDDVYDASVAGSLEQLSASVAS